MVHRKYKNIWLDADGTLLDFPKSEEEAIRQTMIRFGAEPTEERVRAYSEINDRMWKMLERGEIVKSVMLRRRFEVFAAYLQITVDVDEMSAFYIDSLSQKGYLLEGAESLCRRLAETHTLYIVTNGFSKVQRGRFAHNPLTPYIREFFVSDELGYEKPDVRYFEAAAARTSDFSKENTLIVGDSLTSDIQGGIGFGLDTCWYNPLGKPLPQGIQPTYVAASFDEIERIITHTVKEDAP